MAKGTGQLLKVLLVVLGIAAWPQLGLLAFCAGQVSRNPCLLPRPSPMPAATPLTHACCHAAHPSYCCWCLQIASSVMYVSVHYIYFWRVMARGTAARDLPTASLRGLLPRRTEQVRHWSSLLPSTNVM